MYRPEWFPQKDVLSMALDLHMSCTGSFDRSIQESLDDYAALKYVIEHWQESIHSPKFDNAVKQVILEAINEFDNLPLEKK